MDELVGHVARLGRYPVKSMGGEQLTEAPVGAAGLLGDRALAVVDSQSQQVVNTKTPGLGPLLLASRATYTAPPRVGSPLPPISLELADGTHVRSDDPDVDEVLTRCLGREVRLVSTAPPSSALVAVRDDLLDEMGVPPQLDHGSLLDALPVSVVTTSSLDRLGAARPETTFDHRRFRMNVVLQTTAPGFLENAWAGRDLLLGEAVRLRVLLPVPRCALTTMAQDGLPRDPAVLRTIARENSLQLSERAFPCLGAYAAVATAGDLRTHDVVSLTHHFEEARR